MGKDNPWGKATAEQYLSTKVATQILEKQLEGLTTIEGELRSLYEQLETETDESKLGPIAKQYVDKLGEYKNAIEITIETHKKTR